MCLCTLSCLSLCRFPSRGMPDYVVSLCVSVCTYLCVFLLLCMRLCVCICVCKYVCVLFSLCRFPSGGMRDHLHGSPSPNSLLLQFPPCNNNNMTTLQHNNMTTHDMVNATLSSSPPSYPLQKFVQCVFLPFDSPPLLSTPWLWLKKYLCFNI